MYGAFLAPLLPALIVGLSLSKAQAGLLLVFMQWPSILQPFIGHLADRINPLYFLVLVPAVSAVLMSLVGLVQDYVALALLLSLVGLGSASLHAVGPVMVGNLSGRTLGRGMGVWLVGGESGRVVGPIAVAGTVSLLTLDGMPWLMIPGLLASAVLYIQLKGIEQRLPDTNRSVSWRQGLQGTRRIVLPILGIIAMESIVTAMLTTYLVVLLSEQGADLWLVGISLSVLQGAAVVGALLAGSLSDWLGHRLVLLVYMLAMPLLIPLLLAVSGWGRFPALLLLGFVMLAPVPVTMALLQETFPDNRALANGLYMALSFGLRSAAIVLVGVLADLVGLRVVFIGSTVVPLLGLPFLPVLPGKSPGDVPDQQNHPQG
jgi:FSR family fosmidomycin resistance protein-like MFS transporter